MAPQPLATRRQDRPDAGDVFRIDRQETTPGAAAPRVVWGRAFGGTAHEEGIDLAADRAGNVSVAAVVHGGPVVLGDGVTVADSVCLLRLDDSGRLDWGVVPTSVGTTDYDYVNLRNRVDVDGSGNTYWAFALGDAGGAPPEVDVGCGNVTLRPPGTARANSYTVVAAYSSAGACLWSRGLSSGTSELSQLSDVVPYDIAASSGRLFLPLRADGATLFHDGSPVLESGEPFGKFLLALNASDGSMAWAKSVTHGSSIRQGPLVVDDLPDGGILFAGRHDGDLEPEPLGCGTPSDGFFMARLDADGNCVWSAGSLQGSAGPIGVVAEADGGAYAIAAMGGDIDLGCGMVVDREAPNPGFLLVRRDASGNCALSRFIGTTGLIGAGALPVGSLAGTAAGDLFFAGRIGNFWEPDGVPVSYTATGLYSSEGVQLARLDPNGHYRWHLALELSHDILVGAREDVEMAAAIGLDGAVYVTGWFQSQLLRYGETSDGQLVHSAFDSACDMDCNRDMFVVKVAP